MIHYLKNPKILTALVYDLVVSVVAFYVAVCLRFETLNIETVPVSNLKTYMGVIVFTQFIMSNVMGLYKGMWRFSSTTDLIRIIKSVVYTAFISTGVFFLWNRLDGFPRSVLIIDLLLVVSGLGGGRFLYRIWKDTRGIRQKNNKKNKIAERPRVIIAGAGSAGSQIVKEFRSNPNVALDIIGFVDDERIKKGRSIHGVSVLGQIADLSKIVEEYNIQNVFIAIPSASSSDLKRIMEICKNTDVEFKTLPKIDQILHGKVELSLLRSINLEDLLGRDPISLDRDSIREMIGDKVIMVSGAGGSIGSEICNQISMLRPRKVVLFEICELFLYKLEMSLKAKHPDIEFVPCIGDVRFRDRVEAVVREHRPYIILHAAAYKHVPMMESNPLEAIYTNVLGTKVLAEVAHQYNVEKFVMISTDKAVNPTNIMGSTKRIAEMICQNIVKNGTETQYITVRFGNVLGSNGSVIPLFKEQIENGGPITVTHKDITRYFMSIPEACQLVLQAATMGKGGEIFVLDMGKPVKIVNLAKDLIKLSGLKPDVDIAIEYTGLRPGEKLYEELFSKDEVALKTNHPKVNKAQSREIPVYFDDLIGELLELKNSSKREDFYKLIKLIVTEFDSTEFRGELN